MKSTAFNKKQTKKPQLSVNIVSVLTFQAILLAFFLIGIISYQQEEQNIIEKFQQTSMRIRDSVIDQIHYESFSAITKEEDMELPIYQELQAKLNSIRVAASCRYLYTAQALPDGSYIYVVDGLSEDAEDFAVPGTPIEPELYDYMERSLNGETVLSDKVMDTEWGKVCTAFFPIFDEPGQVYGILCMEFDMEDSAWFLLQFRTVFFIASLVASLIITLIVSLFYSNIRKAKESAQTAKNEMLIQVETILNGVTGGLVICKNDAEFSYEHVSEAAASIQGYTAEELSKAAENSGILNICPEDRNRIVREIEKQYANGDMYSVKYRVRHKDGSIRWLQENSKRVVNENGETLHYCFCQDITDVEKQTKLLRQERKQYRDALIHNCEFFYSFDVTEGIIPVEVNNASIEQLREKLGLTLPIVYDDMMATLVGQWNPRFLNESGRKLLTSKGILEQYKKGERTFEFTYYVTQSDIYFRVRGYMTRNEDDNHIWAVMIGDNVTEERREDERARQALEDAYERANRANAAKSDFLSSMSHDIRTPMNAIIGMTAIAGTHLEDKDRLVDCLSKITVASKHLLGIINEVLDMSKIESGKVDLQEEAFSLPELIDNLLAMSRPQIEEKQHKLIVEIHDIQHERVIGDSQRIQQIFMNMMSNAIKYTPVGGNIRFGITEKTSSQPRIGCYEFIFEDNGIGISPQFLDHVFEPFTRDEYVQKNQIQGTGLGLAISQNIVQMMDGTISVESEMGKGTCFTVTIYLKLQDADESLDYEEFVDLPVLVVDDDLTACEMACTILDELGMRSEWVLSGREAVEKVTLRAQKPEAYFAVIIDWKMPDMDGLATTREIRKRVGDDVPIIIISAYDWSDIELEARAAGANAFIKKPLFKSRMAHLFRELMGKENGEAEKAEIISNSIMEAKFAGKRVLLVEDNELNAEIATEILNMKEIDVERARDGQEAVDIMVRVPDDYFDLIFMDLQMPVLNGYEAARAIRALPRAYTKRVPIVAMTANAFEEDIRETRNAGMNEHMTKPLDMGRLDKTLEKWLNLRDGRK